MPYIGDGRSLGGQTTTGDYIYTRTRPFCCLTADSAAQPVDVCGPPFGDFRARARPLRQEPEWQLNDLDVQEAWRQIDEEALDVMEERFWAAGLWSSVLATVPRSVDWKSVLH